MAGGPGPAGRPRMGGEAPTTSQHEAVPRERGAIVGPGVAALGVEQRCARSDADAASDTAERADLVFRGYRKAEGDVSQGILGVRASGVGLEAPDPDAAGRLPVVTDS